ncbi:MAG: hypothetical protein QXP88_00715 [Thermoproteota archaeon]
MGTFTRLKAEVSTTGPVVDTTVEALFPPNTSVLLLVPTVYLSSNSEAPGI